MAATQIQELRQSHMEIMQVILANPRIKLRELSAITGFSQSWLSIIINSDAFQSRLQELNQEQFTMLGRSIDEKLHTIVDVGLEKIAEHVERSEDPEFVRDTVDKVLGRLGYGGRAAATPVGPMLQQNNYYITPEELRACRSNMFGPANVIQVEENPTRSED